MTEECPKKVAKEAYFISRGRDSIGELISYKLAKCTCGECE